MGAESFISLMRDRFKMPNVENAWGGDQDCSMR
jgi:hypothetical protein